MTQDKPIYIQLGDSIKGETRDGIIASGIVTDIDCCKMMLHSGGIVTKIYGWIPEDVFNIEEDNIFYKDGTSIERKKFNQPTN